MLSRPSNVFRKFTWRICKLPWRFRRFFSKKFFENLNPLNGFKDKDELETYLYNQSQKIEPKDGEIPHVKPKHPPEALRSPGVKPPKTPTGNSATFHRSRSHNSSNRHTSSSAMSSPRSPTGAVAFSGRHASSSQVTSPTLLGVPNSNVFFSSLPNDGESNFAVVDINPSQTSRWLGDMGRVNQAFTSEYAPVSPGLSPVPSRFTFPTPPPQHANQRRKPPLPLPGASPTSPTIPTANLGAPPLPPKTRRKPAPPPPTIPGEEPLPLLGPSLVDTLPPPLAPKPAKLKTPTSPTENGEPLVVMSPPPLQPKRGFRKPPIPLPLQLPAEECASTSSPSRFLEPQPPLPRKPPASLPPVDPQ